MAALSITDICNYAIALVGAVGDSKTDFLETFDGDPSDPSSLPAMAWCQRLYPRAMAYSQIKLAPPECLQYAATGAALAGASIPKNPGWAYVYAKPSTCLRFLGVVYYDGHDVDTGEDIPVPHFEFGPWIACDYVSTNVYFKYIGQLDDCTKFSEGLVICTAHRLAYLIARPMGVDAVGRTELLKEFDVVLTEAKGLTGVRQFRQGPTGTIDRVHYRTTSRRPSLAQYLP